MGKKRIVVIAGDGIGKETMPEGLRVVGAAARKCGIDLSSKRDTPGPRHGEMPKLLI